MQKLYHFWIQKKTTNAPKNGTKFQKTERAKNPQQNGTIWVLFSVIKGQKFLKGVNCQSGATGLAKVEHESMGVWSRHQGDQLGIIKDQSGSPQHHSPARVCQWSLARAMWPAKVHHRSFRGSNDQLRFIWVSSTNYVSLSGHQVVKNGNKGFIRDQYNARGELLGFIMD